MSIKIEEIHQEDQANVLEIVSQFWGDVVLVVHGDIYHAADLDGFKAVIEKNIVGILHYKVRDQVCEILTLASLHPRKGIGSALLTAVESLARSQGCLKLSLMTTNDNLYALGFYQRRDFQLAGFFSNQVAVSRQIKPSIPLIGENNIPLRDELLLEKHI